MSQPWSFDKDLTHEFEDKYKITQKKIKINGIELYQFFITDVEFETSDILFIKTPQGFYEPYLYNVRQKENGEYIGSVITKGSCYYYWIIVVRELLSQIDKTTKKKVDGALYLLQYILSFKILQNVLNDTGRTIQALATRQFGKTEFTVALDSFIMIFIPKFVKIDNAKYWVIISSYSTISVGELFEKFKTKVKAVVDIFHREFPYDTLVTGAEAKKYPPHNNLKDTDEKVEYGLLMDGQVYPYSVCLAIPAGTVRDGEIETPSINPSNCWESLML